jgi:hypothetical protein
MNKVTWGRFLWVLIPAVFLFTLQLFTLQSFADSHVRIVRLSDVEGSVQVDRNTGQGFEPALLNLPITQGVKLRTNDDSRAEVEFEDGATLRLGSDSTVYFEQLSLTDSGVKESVIVAEEGVVYVDCSGKSGSDYTFNFAGQTVKIDTRVHFRLEMDQGVAALAVFSGEVHVKDAVGSGNPVEDVFVEKNQTAVFNLQKLGKYEIAKKIRLDLFDDWDKSQKKYHDRYLSQSASRNYSPYSYGLSDLSYYGSYVNVPGCGLAWQPYLAGANWNPFMNGAWAWYPGAGYVWVSAYPWGWTPYYYGSWSYLQTTGWYWCPGSNWNSWNSMPVIVKPPQTFRLPRPPVRPPVVRRGGRTLFVVNTHPGFMTHLGQKTILRSDSASLGIPRGGIRNWHKVTAEVQREGVVKTEVHVTAPLPTFATNPEFSQQGFGPASSGFASGSTRGSSGPHNFPTSGASRSQPANNSAGNRDFSNHGDSGRGYSNAGSSSSGSSNSGSSSAGSSNAGFSGGGAARSAPMNTSSGNSQTGGRAK